MQDRESKPGPVRYLSFSLPWSLRGYQIEGLPALRQQGRIRHARRYEGQEPRTWRMTMPREVKRRIRPGLPSGVRSCASYGQAGAGAEHGIGMAVAARSWRPEQADRAAAGGTTAVQGAGSGPGTDDPAVPGVPGAVSG